MDAVAVFDNLDMAAVGARLRQARQAAGLSQREAARRCDLSVSNYCRLETGHAQGMRVEALHRLCQVLVVSADVVMGLRG